MKLPPTTYEQYKKMNQDRATSQSHCLNKGGQRQIQSASNKEREKSIGFQGVASGMANAVDQKTPQQMSRHQGTEHQAQVRPMTGVANQNSHSAQSGSHKMTGGVNNS